MLAAGAGSLFAAIAEGSGINSPSSSGIGKMCLFFIPKAPVRAFGACCKIKASYWAVDEAVPAFLLFVVNGVLVVL